MDFEKYRDIAPYRGDDFKEALLRLGSSLESLTAFVSLLSDEKSEEKKMDYFNFIIDRLKSVTKYEDFQANITAGVLVPGVIKKTMEEFTVSGIENIESDKGYLFVSNHRDIILDCALLDYALLSNGKPLCEMAFGDNLMANKFIEDLLRLNGGIIVRRSMTMRAKYLETVKLSEYFNKVIKENKRSIWIAQRSGRSKDGIDKTQTAIVKMLHLSNKEVSFNQLVNDIGIVPVSISYELDPNDINKAREAVSRLKSGGEYEKKKYEDVISMVKGMKGKKGRVHLAISEPIKGNFENAEEIADIIDKMIHKSYKLWPTNLFSYDTLEGTSEFKEETKDFDGEGFLSRLAHLSPEVREYVLSIYANPVRMAKKA